MPRTIFFKDYPDFKPNITPRDMFLKGVFGGGYWRTIYSNIANKTIKNDYKKYDNLYNIPIDLLTNEIYNKNVNKYTVETGTSLNMWEEKGWIAKPYYRGWVEWYINFYNGRRTYDDIRQIKRWNNIAGPRGRFKIRLINMINDNNSNYNDYTVSPKIRQVLLEWGYEITKKDIK